MTDEGALRLITGARSPSHLERLDVSDNFLTAAVKRDVMRLAKRVEWGTQRTPDEWDGEAQRYVSVGE